ncbi:MAG TPA: epimerase [Desulfobulbaceae bacterium]|nr:MAG: epimerase [Deltaproteobacteria bacterium RIFOXYD12_FULL_53_23]HCC53857.1 epimerase [Desulfobulbaceae bacterium]
MMPTTSEKIGVLLGGSGLLGGAVVYYFKTHGEGRINVLAPNSKKLSLRDPDDIRRYFERSKPAFIINCAIAAIDSDPQLAYEINYLGTVYLAKAAQELGVPYIHLSSAAVMPTGHNLSEEARLNLRPDLPNYTKAKLMAELTLEHLRRSKGLDYTIIRLGIVYGAHDHKIQGFHRLFFAIIDRAMPVLFTKQGAMHSYSNARKLPYFIAQLLENRTEFSGQIYNFVDSNPVSLSQLILTIKAYLELKTPREIYLPFFLAKFGMGILTRFVRLITRLGIDARMPAELMFLKKFYETQTLSAAKLRNSSFRDPYPEATIFTELPALIEYYVTRWEHLNLIESVAKKKFDPRRRSDEFIRTPDQLLQEIHEESGQAFLMQCPLVRSGKEG